MEYMLYTLFPKKLYPFYFCDNFVGHEPILIIFGKNVAKEIGDMQSLTCLLFGGKYSIHFVANFLRHVTTKNYENWFTDKKKLGYCKNKMV